MEPKTQDLKNDKLELRATEQAGCRIQFEITLMPSACQEAHNEAIKAVRKQVDLPGFRKGRVPTEMVVKHFQRAIDSEWRDRIAQSAFRSAVELSNIYPWSLDQVQPADIKSLSKEEGAILSFQFEREPEVPAVEVEKLDLSHKEVKDPSEEEVSSRIATFLEHHGTYEAVEGRTVQEGDYVRVDAHSLEKEPPQQLVENGQLLVSRDKIPHWMVDHLVGMALEETKEGQTAPDPDMSPEQKETFKPAQVRVFVRAIETLVPPADEKLCEAMGVDSMEALRERVHNQLTKEIESQHEGERRKILWEQVIQAHPFELPASMLDSEKRRMVRLMVNQMRQEIGEAGVLKKEQEIEALASQQAVSHLLQFFLARKIVGEAGNQASEQEVIARAVQLMIHDQAGEPSNETQRKQLWDMYRNEAFFQLLVQKAEESLLGKEGTDKA